MIIKIIKQFVIAIAWQYFFYKLERVNYINFINNFSTQLLAMSILDTLRFYRDLITNAITNNIFFRVLAVTTGVNVNSLTDTNSKRFFWLGLAFTLIVYRWLILFKKLILWPFKLGVFTFIFSTLGIDLTWFLSWFNIFYFNIPQWVYFQYLTLYSNWLNWWNNTVKIKNLNVDLLPTIKKTYSSTDNDESTGPNEKINKKYYIILGVVVIIGIGVGIWYYFYNDIGANGGGGNPPNPPNPPTVTTIDTLPHQINVSDAQNSSSSSSSNRNLTSTNEFSSPELRDFAQERGIRYNPSRFNLLDRLAELNQKDPDLLRQDRIDNMRQERLADILSSERLSAPSSPIASTSTLPDPVSPPTSPIASTSTLPDPVSPPRAPSPTGSDDSSETIKAYISPENKWKFAIYRKK